MHSTCVYVCVCDLQITHQTVDWSAFGFCGRDGRQSTYWLGSQGANTACHYDTYGCNLVAQIYGRYIYLLSLYVAVYKHFHLESVCEQRFLFV